MQQNFNYRHLYYFWVVAKEGGLTRAAERLDMAVQTISTQVRELEKALGVTLLRPEGRNLVLTEAGVVALHEADHIFALGEKLPLRVREAVHGQSVKLSLGISDGIAKLAVHRLLAPVLNEPHLRLLCHEGEFEQLLAELVMHKLDAILTDRPIEPNPHLRLTSLLVSSSVVAWYAPTRWHAAALRDFPRSLMDVPLLLPTTHSTLRHKLDQWLAHEHITPHIAGEFEDSALLATFGAGGMGALPAALNLQGDMLANHGLELVGVMPEVQEHIHWIHTPRKIMHPLSLRVLAAHQAS